MATASASRYHRIALTPQLSQRGSDLTVDAKLSNGFVDRDPGGEVWVYKRYGLQLFANYGTVSGIGLGCYTWRPAQGAAFIRGIYTITGDGNAAINGVLLGTVDTTVGQRYWFNPTLGTPSNLYFSNGVKGYYTTTGDNLLHTITDVNYPATTVPGSAYLDGTLYVMDVQANIWGSANLNNVAAWSATNVIRAQAEPDLGVAIAKQNVYVIAFKQWTTEVFYDAGVGIGSPLLPVQNARLQVGCGAAYSVASIDDKLYFIGTNRNATTGIYVIDNLRLREISTPAIGRLLEQSFTVPNWAWGVRFGGHTFYGVNISVGGVTTTLTYDITTNAWYVWPESPGLGGGMNVSASTYDVANNVYYFQEASAGNILRNFSPTQYSDYNGEVITVDGVTPIFDGGLKVRKVMTRLRAVCDQKGQGSLQIRWSDDDYQTWSNWQTISLQQLDPMLTNLGTFRRRAFQFRHQSPTPFRMQGFDVELLPGVI